MKKLALLSAIMTLGMSSWAFAADNPPPPEKGAQHQGKPPVKNGQHDGKQAQYNSKSHNETANRRSMMASSRSTMASSRSTMANNRSTTASSRQKGASTAGNRCRRKRNTLARLPRQAFFHPSSAIVDKLLPFFEMPEKACIAPDIVCPRHCSVEKRYVKEKHKRPAVAVRIIFRASVGPSSGTRVLSGAKSRTAAAARSG